MIVCVFGGFKLEILAHPKQIDAVVVLMIDLPEGLREVRSHFTSFSLLGERQVPELDTLLQLHYPDHLLHGDPGFGKNIRIRSLSVSEMVWYSGCHRSAWL